MAEKKTETRVIGLRAACAWTLTLFTFGYFAPWAIAETRNLPNKDVISSVNLFLGWTLIGWFYALWMSFATVPATSS